MSSGTSTDGSTLRPWHLFVLAALVAATVAVLVGRPSEPAGLVLLILTILAAGFTGLALYRTLWPLAASDFVDRTEMIGQRTRAAIEREKTLVLRSIKELEFDQAMGKLSDTDFQEMAGRLRSRAIGLMKQLDQETPAYRDLIERELQERLERLSLDEPQPSPPVRRVCAGCGVDNEPDAKFCKECGGLI